MAAVLAGYGTLIFYFALCLVAVLLLRRSVVMPAEIFRKILHLVALGSILVLVYAIEPWWVSALVAVAFTVTVFPILWAAERIPGFSEFLTERKRGELKRSLVTIFSMFVLLVFICWGWYGERYLVVAAVMAWGLGDAAAALIGKRYGRNYIEGRLIEGRKTLEGTLAMFSLSFVSVLVVLPAHEVVAWQAVIPIAILTAAVCAVVELYTRSGMDTFTCPLAAAAVLIPLVRLCDGVGG